MGTIIAIIGIDGSGKSTFIENVGLPSKHFYRNNKVNNKTNSKKPTVIKPSMVKVLVGTILKIYFPNLFVYFRYKFLSKKTMVFDRYSYDFHGRLQDKSLFGKALNFIFKYFPTPDYVIFLDIDPALAFQRKNEFDIPFLERKRKLLKQATQHLPEKKLFTIDPSETFSIHLNSSFLNELFTVGLRIKKSRN